MLTAADIRIGGDRPWDVRVLNNDLYARVVAEGMLGVGETYMDGWWECEQLDEMICRAFRADFHRQIRPLKYLLFVLQARLTNLQRQARAFQVGHEHYDLGQDLYRATIWARIFTERCWTNA